MITFAKLKGGWERTLKFMSRSWAQAGGRQYFRATLCHENGVFELGRQFPVCGPDCPTVRFGGAGIRRTLIDHRFDREAHSR